MGRSKNDIETVTLTISTTRPVEAHLKGLVETGLYGKNAAEAAERLVARALEQIIENGVLAGKSRTIKEG